MYQQNDPWAAFPLAEQSPRPPAGPGYIPSVRPTPPPDPRLPGQIASDQVGIERTRQMTTQANTQGANFQDEHGLRTQFQGLPHVRQYTQSLAPYYGALRAADNRAGDMNLVYATANLLDPGAVVRESDAAMVARSASIPEYIRGAINTLNGGGQLTAETRAQIRAELRTRGRSLGTLYGNARQHYSDLARRYGFDPAAIVGPEHPELEVARQAGVNVDGRPRQSEQQTYRITTQINGRDLVVEVPGPPGMTPEQARQFGDRYMRENYPRQSFQPTTYLPPDAGEIQTTQPGSYGDSLLSQSLSGANEGLAGTLGLPVDLMEGAVNLIPSGIDAIANTNLPRLQDSYGGSNWWSGRGRDAGAIMPESGNATNQFARRTAQSVGSAAIPLLGASGTLGRAGIGLTSALFGGAGAATAQQVAPGNPYAEAAGELIGSVGGAGGAIGLARRGAQRRAERAVPSADELRQQAGAQYSLAESRGVVAGPNVTTNLAGRVRQMGQDEAIIGPTGRVLPGYDRFNTTMRVLDSFAGRDMTARSIDRVRRILAGNIRASADDNERRVNRMALEAFDAETGALAPELQQGRRLASRYLQADRIGLARERSGARAGGYSQSGDENALRTDFRALDNAIINGSEQFPESVTAAIRGVSRGTPGSNAARGIGKLAPRGVVSFGAGAGVPFMVGNAFGGPVMGAVAGGGSMLAGEAGRAVATRMTRRQSELADILARAGGNVNAAPTMTPELYQLLLSLGVTQSNPGPGMFGARRY